MRRCPKCYRRVDADLLGVHVCLVPPSARAARHRPRVAPKPRRPQAAKVAGRDRAEYLATVASPHGTIRRYQHGCRCDACRAKNYEAVKAYRARKRERVA